MTFYSTVGPSEGEGKVINKNTLPEHRWRKHNGKKFTTNT